MPGKVNKSAKTGRFVKNSTVKKNPSTTYTQTTKKGKSFADIAASYKGKPDPTAGILEMFKTGGKDDHDKVPGSDADLKAVIAFVLSK